MTPQELRFWMYVTDKFDYNLLRVFIMETTWKELQVKKEMK